MRTTTVRRTLLAGAALLMLAGACSKTEETKTGAGSSTTAAGSTGSTTAGGGTSGTTKTKGTTVGTAPSKEDLKKLIVDVKLKATGTLTVCSDIPYAPFEFPGDDGKLTGFDVQVLDAMAESLGLETDWKTTPFDTIFAAVAAGECDVVASATTITPERQEKVNFTDGYFDANQSLLVTAANKDKYKKLEDLTDQTIGVQASTTGATYAEEHKPSGATIKEYPGADDLFLAVTSGDIAAVLQDFPVNKYRALKNPSQFDVTETFQTDEEYGFATSKDNERLTTALDTALTALKATGEYDTIYETWFGEKP